MKLKEYIKMLEALDQESEVIVTSSNFEMNGALISAHAPQAFKATQQIGNFRDAFDGALYKSQTWSLLNGDTPVIIL